MKATEYLRLDHRALEALFAEYESAGNQPDRKKELYERIRLELDLHSEVVEQLFFPAMREAQPAETGFSVQQALAEGQKLKDLIREISTLDPVEDEFDDLMHELRQHVERHIREEEGEMFSDAAERLSRQRLEELGQRMEQIRLTVRRDLRRTA
jgi:hypothetical protein